MKEKNEKGLERINILTENAAHNYDQAIKLSNEYLDKYKNDVYILLQLGFAYKKNKDYQNAIDVYDYILSIDSYNPVARLDLFDIYMETKQYDVAKPILDEIFSSSLYKKELESNREKYEKARELINNYIEVQKLKINA